MQFEEAFKFIMKYEGGYSNHPNDKGGETNYGISTRFIRANGLDIKNVRDITVQQAKDIYRTYFWDLLKANCFNDDIVQLFLFDTAANCGVGRATEILQIALNAWMPISIDGIVGKETISTCNSMVEQKRNKALLYEMLKANRIGYYETIIRNNGKLRTFLKGWVNRVVELFKYGTH